MAKTQTKAETSKPQTFSLVSDEKLVAIYATMLKLRLLEQRATELFQHGKIDSDLHRSADLEATVAAAVIDLEPEDTLCLAPDDWLPAFVKGMSLETMIRVLAPASLNLRAAAEIEAAHKNIIFPSAEVTPTDAVRERASASMAAKNGAVTNVFIPAGPKSIATWHETIRAAGSKKLPIIFVHFSQAADVVSKNPEALVHGVPRIAVDAHDPVAIYRVAYEAIVRARQRRGATLVQCMTDIQPVLDRAESSLAGAASNDPLDVMKRYLKSKGIEPELHNGHIVAAFNHELDLATRFLDR